MAYTYMESCLQIILFPFKYIDDHEIRVWQLYWSVFGDVGPM